MSRLGVLPSAEKTFEKLRHVTICLGSHVLVVKIHKAIGSRFTRARLAGQMTQLPKRSVAFP